ncbi:MAG: AAA family ATPase, partial [Deltaproteobacteria bacterium]|nr:AAA family ATPase [Deltaproteobacteria bacterium]
MRRLAFINEKGGTCKTTLAVSVAAWLATERRARVLLVDLDTQGHAGKSLGLDVRALEPNVFHWLSDDAVQFEDVVRPTAVPGLELVPSYKQMGDFPVA